jgi:hypothetical protein
MGAKGLPVKPDLEGVSIVVWDADQPAMPGTPTYRAEATRVVRDFCARYGVTVDLKFVPRQEMSDLLSGATGGESPALVYSTEWPSLPDSAYDVGPYLGQGDHLGAAVEYWRKDDKTLAIPSYVHWLCAASRAEMPGEDSSPGAVGPKTAYMPDSPGFLRSFLDLPGAGWDSEAIVQFLSWVKGEYGPPGDDPLGAWAEGDARMLWPATPFMLAWMKSVKEGQGEIEPLPLENPFGEPRFYYTVPGYLVLATDGLERECATLLGKELAANLGRWVARAAGGVPSLWKDAVIFNLESSLGYASRTSLLSSLDECRFHAPASQDFLARAAVEKALWPVIGDYLSGKTGEGDLRASIQDILQRHTKP